MSGVVVTGGTGNLGRAVVAHLLAAGVRVAVPYRRAAAWESLRADSPGDLLWGETADIADPDAARGFCDRAAEALGGLHGLAALAGAYAGSGPVEKAPVAEWEAMLRANLASAYAACRAALPHLLKSSGSGVLVTARKVATGGGGSAAYAVSKAGVLALTRALAQENEARGVRFNCVAPGTIDTPDNRRAMPKADPSAWTPPEAIARVVVFLLGEESRPITGAVVPVDGRA